MNVCTCAACVCVCVCAHMCMCVCVFNCVEYNKNLFLLTVQAVELPPSDSELQPGIYKYRPCCSVCMRVVMHLCIVLTHTLMHMLMCIHISMCLHAYV